MRSNARNFAFKVIFSTLFENNIELTKQNLLEEEKLSEKDLFFAEEIITAFNDNREILNKNLEQKLEGYAIDRIYNVDLALIYLGMTEILYIKTPKAVVINEVLEIAKQFSTEKSKSFINGVLAKIE